MCGQLMALIEPMNVLHELDWNLWLVLDQLLETGSVTEAARRLGRTQSAVSHSLASLRELFGDPLFVRIGARFEPTPRAKALAGPVRELMDGAARVLTPPASFVAATLQRTFRVLLSDYGQVVLLPGLMERLSAEAPKVVLDVHFRSDALAQNFAEVASGRIELTVAPMIQGPPGMVRQRLYDDHNVCVLREGNPALKRFTVERFAALPHVQVSARGLGPDFVDQALKKQKLARRIVLRVPHFATAPHLVTTTDAVAVVPHRIAQSWHKGSGVTFVEAPLPLPAFSMCQYFPELLRNDPAHAWFRRLVHEVAQA
jgi:DNA-binding transcriptional LysR family regulator